MPLGILRKSLSVLLCTPIIAVSFFYGCIILGEGYNLFFPDIDTKYTPAYTKAKFDSLQQGMDTTTVLNIIGQPFCTIYNNDENGHTWYYSNDGACKCFDFAWLEKYIIVDSVGKITRKVETVAYD